MLRGAAELGVFGGCWGGVAAAVEVGVRLRLLRCCVAVEMGFVQQLNA